MHTPQQRTRELFADDADFTPQFRVASLASTETLGGVHVVRCVVRCQLAPNQGFCACSKTVNFIVFEKRRMRVTRPSA